MTADQAQTLKSTWLAQHGGTKRSIAVLNATTEFHPISISPGRRPAGQSTREWSLRDVALAFGVPAYMLGVPGDSSTYANVEIRMIELRTFTLLPWQRRIESTLDAQLPKGTSAEGAELTGCCGRTPPPATTPTRPRSTAGWLTVDEVRELEDRPPLPATEGVL